MKFKKAIALTVSALLTFMNMSNIVMAEEQQPITDGVQKINANNLKWTPVSSANQLGGADDFSGIFFNELKDFNETGGPVAVGSLKNVKIVTFDVGYSGGINQFNDIIIPKFNIGVMAQKEVNIGGSTLISNGDAVIGNSVDPQKLSTKTGNIYKRHNEIDKFLGDAKADLVKLNKDLWNTKETAKVIYDGNTVILDCVDGFNIFEVDLTSGRKNIQFNYPENAKDFTIIIKYKGNIINYGETFIGNTMLDKINVDEISNRVIWTFDPSLKEVKIDRTIVFGSILAPNADITFSPAGYSAINGTIIANGLDGSGSSSEIHWVGPFKGDILTPIEKTGSFKFNKIDNYDKAVNGASFALYQDGVEKYTTTSTDAGVVSFSGIKEGSYILKETIAPDGYEISADEVIVTVDKDGKVTFNVDGKEETLKNLNGIFVNNVSKVEFEFKKVISGTGDAIPKVEFKLMQGDEVVSTAISNENGVVSFENIELGTYTLIETIPTGYKEAGPWTVNVTKEGAFIDESKLEIIENKKIAEKAGSFKFNKVDNYNNPVKGAEFALYQDGEVKYTSISTGNLSLESILLSYQLILRSSDEVSIGEVYFSGIKQGTYILRETTAPDGYEISTDEVIVTVDKDGKVTFNLDGEEEALTDLNGIFVNNISKTEFSFKKVVSGTTTGIPNVEFKLMQGEKIVATVTSDENGLVSFKNIELGPYTLVETRPFGYEAAGPWTINVTKEGAFIGEKELDNIQNVEVIGAFEFNKLDNHDKSVNGAIFGLYQDGVEKYTETSTDTGLVSFSGIKEGTYILKETTAPDGYEISNAVVEVTVDSNGTVILKVGEEDKELADLDNLYINNISTVEFNFNKVIAKTDTGIPGVEFKLMQGDKVVATAISNENGVVSFENIELGTYTLIETTPTGYKEARPWTVNVTKEGAFIDESKLEIIENEKIAEKTGLFQFNKLDNHNNPVNGAEFALYQDEEVKYTAISTDTGLVSFSGIKEGNYTLKETSAPKGYEISKAEVEVTVNSDGTVTFKESGVVKTGEDLESLYINKMILGSISFTKYINDKKGILAGAEFELLINGERYGSSVFSDANGLVTFLNVKPGEYEIREVSSHSKYFKASDKAFTVVIDENGVSSLDGEDKAEAETLFINKVENSIEFIKYSDSNSVLSNATFELLMGTEVISTSISNKNGVVRFENLLPGEYILREKSAPKGYIKSDATRKLVVKDNGEISITASEIKEWEEVFKNKKVVEPKEEKPEKNEEITIPKTSDDANVIFPLITAIISLAGIVFIKRIKH